MDPTNEPVNGTTTGRVQTEDERFAEIKAKLTVQARAKHPDVDVHGYKLRGQRYIARTLTPEEYTVFKTEGMQDKERTLKVFSAVEDAFDMGILYPTGDELAALLRKKPGIRSTIGQLILADSGQVDADEATKF